MFINAIIYKCVSKRHEFKLGLYSTSDFHDYCTISGGQLYAATVADYFGGEPLIHRERIRTERSDLNQLNGKVNFQFRNWSHIYKKWNINVFDFLWGTERMYNRTKNRMCLNMQKALSIHNSKDISQILQFRSTNFPNLQKIN